MKRLEKRVAVITGAGQGIGRAIALGLAREGAKIVIAEVNEENANAVKNEIEAAGGTAVAIRTGVSDEASVQGMIQKSLEMMRRQKTQCRILSTRFETRGRDQRSIRRCLCKVPAYRCACELGRRNSSQTSHH